MRLTRFGKKVVSLICLIVYAAVLLWVGSTDANDGNSFITLAMMDYAVAVIAVVAFFGLSPFQRHE